MPIDSQVINWLLFIDTEETLDALPNSLTIVLVVFKGGLKQWDLALLNNETALFHAYCFVALPVGRILQSFSQSLKPILVPQLLGKRTIQPRRFSGLCESFDPPRTIRVQCCIKKTIPTKRAYHRHHCVPWGFFKRSFELLDIKIFHVSMLDVDVTLLLMVMLIITVKSPHCKKW